MAVALSAGVARTMEYVVLCLAPSACFWLALNGGRIARWVARRWRMIRPAPPAPVGPPLELISADIRRIRSLIAALPPQAPWARRFGTLLAYDDALSAACRALDLDDPLNGLPYGSRRDATRVQVEAELECAGLVSEPRDAA